MEATNRSDKVPINEANEWIPTRQSLLSRLKDSSDQESWREFFDIYWKLIYTTAVRAGLTDAEAQDAVQETVLSVLKAIRNFEYDSAKGSFKNWLRRLTQRRIVDQFRKRRPEVGFPAAAGVDTGTAPLERVPDPASMDLTAGWEEQWEQNFMDVAIERVKRRVDPKHYQIFDLYVLRQWPISKVTRTLGISAAKVYVVKHRISNLLKKETQYLKSRPVVPVSKPHS